MKFLLFILVPLLVGLWAQYRVSSVYNKWIKVASRGRITGAEAASAVMRKGGIYDVEIVETSGHLTDHYDPTHKRLVLSSQNYRGTSLAALGVAAHEAGHALQHKQGYKPLEARMALIPITNFASQMLPIVMFGGYFFLPMHSMLIINLAIFIYLILTVFQLVTLPVEFDASRRAKAMLVSLGILQTDEMKGVHQTLDAAAFTYLAAFISSLGWLLYYLNIAEDRR